MKLLPRWFAVASLVVLPCLTQAAELREWRHLSGKVASGWLVEVRDNDLRIRTVDGRFVDLRRSEMSQADQNYLTEYAGAEPLPDGKVDNVAKDTSYQSSQVTKRDEKLELNELDLEFSIYETPHFFILERGSSRARDTAEDAERLWNEMAYIHPDFARKWTKKKMAIFMVEDESDYIALGEWYANQVKAQDDGSNPHIGRRADEIKLTWPRSSAGNILINRDIAEENDLMRMARVFWVREPKDWRGKFVPFRVHCLSSDLLDIHVGGVSGYAREGWFALSTGHSFFREIDLCDQVQTRLLDADAYEGDEVFEAGGFDDGRSWAKTLRELVRDGKVDPKLEGMYGLSVSNLKPETCVLTYGLNQFLQSTVHRRAAYAELMERIHVSSQVPVPDELVKIYGYSSVEEFDRDWAEYMKSTAFR